MRKSKYTEELVRQMESLLVIGQPNKNACEVVGITEETFYQWFKNTPRKIWECKCKIRDENNKKYNKTYEFATEEEIIKHCETCKSDLLLKPAFSERVKKAKAYGQAKMLEVIEIAADKSWQAAAWKLERVWTSEFGRQIKPVKYEGAKGDNNEFIDYDVWRKEQEKKEKNKK